MQTWTRVSLALAAVLCATSVAAQEALPETARGPAIDPEKGYLVEEIRDGLYWVSDGTYNTMFLVSEEGVIAVDAPPSLGENLLNAIDDVTDEPVTHVVYSHSHGDHVGAAHIFPDEAEYVAHADTASQLARAGDPQRPAPTTTFEDTHTSS